jgi:hypothetical protein
MADYFTKISTGRIGIRGWGSGIRPDDIIAIIFILP